MRKEDIIKIIVISIIVIINLVLIIAVINSVKTYVDKINRGEIQQIAEDVDDNVDGNINLTEGLKNIIVSLSVSEIINMVLLLTGIVLVIEGVIIYIKV